MSDVGVDGVLELSIDDALAGVARIEAELAAAVTGVTITVDTTEVTDALTAAIGDVGTSVELEADGTPVSDAIEAAIGEAPSDVELEGDATPVGDAIEAAIGDADSEVAVDADASAVTEAVDEALQNADTTITVDSTQAEESLTGVSSSADAAQSSLSGAGAAASGFTVASAAAGGSARPLVGLLGNLGTGGVVAAGGLTATVAVVGSLFTSALRATSAQQRFNAVLGESAERVNQVDVAGLDVDLADLAFQTGSAATGLREAAASVFQFGTSSGAARPDVERTTESILALASRAVALNPSLGQAGDVARVLSSALATGGRRLQTFGIDLTSVEIKARAAEIALSHGREEVTRFDLVTAGAQLSLEKVGNTLAADVASGAENVEIQFRQVQRTFKGLLTDLGKPLVSPILELLADAAPLGAAVAGVFASIAQISLPALSAGLGIVGPLLQAFSTGLQAVLDLLAKIPGPVLAVVAGYAAIALGARLALAAMLLLQANPIGVWATGIAVTLTALGAILGLVGNETASTSEDAAELARNVATLGGNLASSGNALDAVAASLSGVRQEAEDLDGVLAASGATNREFAEGLAAIQEQGDLGPFFESFIEGAGLTGQAAEAAFEDLANFEQITQRAAEALLINARDAGLVSETALAGAAARDSADGYTNWVAILREFPAAAGASEEAVAQLAEGVASNVPTISDALGELDTAAGDLAGFVAATDPQQVIDNLFQMVQAFTDFTSNLEIIREFSPLVAQALGGLGPEVAGAFAQGLAQAPPAMTEQLELVLAVAQEQGLNLTEVLTGTFGTAAEGAVGAVADRRPRMDGAGRGLGDALDKGATEGARPMPDRIGGFADDASSRVRDRQRVAQVSASFFGSGFTRGTGEGAKGMSPAATGAASAAIAAVRGIPGAFAGGHAVGSALTAGMTAGIAAGAFSVVQSARNVIDQAVQAAMDQADIGSPSKLFAREVGVPIAEGIAVGFESGAVGIANSIARAVTPSRGLAEVRLADGVGRQQPQVLAVTFAPGSIVVEFGGVPTEQEAVRAGRGVARGIVDGIADSQHRRTDVALAQRS